MTRHNTRKCPFFTSVLPRHSMFLNVDRNTSEAVLFLLETSFQYQAKNKESSSLLKTTFFVTVIHDFYPDLENNPQSSRARVSLNLFSKG